MTGPDAEGFAAIATNRVDAVTSHALSGGLSASSTTAKSAVSALSDSCTRTVAAAGSSVKLTWRSACHGTALSCTLVSPTAMQGRGRADNPPRANTAITRNGTTEARILKRNMIRHSLNDQPATREGLW